MPKAQSAKGTPKRAQSSMRKEKRRRHFLKSGKAYTGK